MFLARPSHGPRAGRPRARGCAPTWWRWREGPNGRPEIDAPGTALHFNLAHSAHFEACALASGREVGVYVEDLNRWGPTDPALIRRFCSPDEAARHRGAGAVSLARSLPDLLDAERGLSQGARRRHFGDALGHQLFARPRRCALVDLSPLARGHRCAVDLRAHVHGPTDWAPAGRRRTLNPEAASCRRRVKNPRWGLDFEGSPPGGPGHLAICTSAIARIARHSTRVPGTPRSTGSSSLATWPRSRNTRPRWARDSDAAIALGSSGRRETTISGARPVRY